MSVEPKHESPSGGFSRATAGLAICRQMALGAVIMGAYGIWIAAGRLPHGLPLGTRIISSIWAVSMFAGLGIALAALIASSSLVVSKAISPVLAILRVLRPQRHVKVAAALETIVLVPLALWFFLNEFTYSKTSQVIGLDALLMIWSIPGAVFQNAWVMGGRYLILAGALAIAAGVATYRLAARSMLVRDGVPEMSASPTRPSQRMLRLAGAMSAYLIILGGLLAVRFHTQQPGEALLIVLKAAPPLRAADLTRAFMGMGLASPVPTHFGEPVVSESQYVATMGQRRATAPNIILILLESVSAPALHCYGHPRADVSPNMDALAAEGTLFEHCISPASFSTYSVVSTMTSMYMLRAPHNDHFHDVTFPFMGLPHMLKLAGYERAIFSSGNEAFDRINHFSPPSDFDTYFTHDTWGKQTADCMRMDDQYAVGHFENWLASRKDPRPFYCSFYLQSTHFNYEVPEPWFSYYKPVPRLYSNGDGVIHIPPDIVPLLQNQYDNSMRYSDYWVSRISSAMAKAGALDNSVIVIVGDHGEAFMQHGLARHGVHLWEEMIHVPLIMWVGPGLRKALPYTVPSRVADSVSSIDIAPTLASLIGVKPHPAWQGVDVLAPGYSGRDRPIYSVLQLTQWMECVTLDKWKYIYDLADIEKSLYNLNVDPSERNNLISREPERAAGLHAMLAGWHTRQLSYYGHRPFDSYIGRYQPPPGLLTAFHNGAMPPDPKSAGPGPVAAGR